MYEYNADTPTSLLEAAVAQWTWLEDMKLPDQFNSIHDKLIARWRLAKTGVPDPMLHLFASKHGEYEDWGNVEYMADTAIQAGWDVIIDDIDALRYDDGNKHFFDRDERDVYHAFKLYPWEWMMEEEFGKEVRSTECWWYEPPWKMLLADKSIYLARRRIG